MATRIKTLDEFCKERDYSIKFNKKKQLCGFKKNDYLFRGDKYD